MNMHRCDSLAYTGGHAPYPKRKTASSLARLLVLLYYHSQSVGVPDDHSKSRLAPCKRQFKLTGQQPYDEVGKAGVPHSAQSPDSDTVETLVGARVKEAPKKGVAAGGSPSIYDADIANFS